MNFSNCSSITYNHIHSKQFIQMICLFIENRNVKHYIVKIYKFVYSNIVSTLVLYGSLNKFWLINKNGCTGLTNWTTQIQEIIFVQSWHVMLDHI